MSSTVDWGKLKILVVEDSADLREVLCSLFESKEPMKISSAANGEIAMGILKQEKIDLVVSDVQMPVCDGVELLKRIRKHNANIPIVFLVTGFADVTAEVALQLGASGLIYKPFKAKEFFTTLESALVHHKPVSTSAYK